MREVAVRAFFSRHFRFVTQGVASAPKVRKADGYASSSFEVGQAEELKSRRALRQQRKGRHLPWLRIYHKKRNMGAIQ
jgi:hypothetical protein